MTVCNYCSTPIDGDPLVLWNGGSYCRKCVEGQCPELVDLAKTDAAIQETLPKEAIRTYLFLYRWCLTSAAFFAVLLGSFCGLIALAGVNALPMFASIFAVAMCFMIALGGLAACFAADSMRAKLPRTISVEGGKLTISCPSKETALGVKETTFDLHECQWCLGPVKRDTFGYYMPRIRAVMLRTPKDHVACGLTPESRRLWEGFLSLARVPRIRDLRDDLNALLCLAGFLTGGLIGAIIGSILLAFGCGAGWVLGLAIFGAIEGACIAWLFVAYLFIGRSDPAPLTGFSGSLGFAVIALVCFAATGMIGCTVAVLVNGLIGWIFAREFRRRVFPQDTLDATARHR